MTKKEAIHAGLELVEKSSTLILGTVDENGYPNSKALFKMEHDGLKHFWFGTNTSSMHLQQIIRNPKASVYAVDFKNFMGLTLLGTIKILQDQKSKQRLWREGFEMYYPQGVTDPDYSVLHFSTKVARYYHGLEKITFEVFD